MQKSRAAMNHVAKASYNQIQITAEILRDVSTNA